MTEPRRVRTQVERDADGVAWHPGGLVAGDPVRIELHPAECVLVVREGVGVMCVRADHDPTAGPDIHYGPPLRPPHLGPKPPADVSWLRTTQPEPRRRWWHRLTRRNP